MEQSWEASRTRVTPAKTPLKGMEGSLKTPLRTPLRSMEQTSSTPITPFEAIESQKENVQPLSRGRSAHALSAALSMQHKERQSVLAAQRQEHEDHVTSEENAESDDPLEAWCAYVKWCVDNYPEGKSAESGLLPLLERATRTFRESEQYRNDSRYLRLWIMYAQNTDVPRDVFQFLLANDIGSKLAGLYEELAHVQESLGMYEDADATFKLGIARRVSPLDRIKRRYQQYQERILAMPTSSTEEAGAPTYAKALASAMARAGRSVLGTKTGRGNESVPTNVLGHHQPLSQAPHKHNARTMHVYEDTENEPVSGSSGARWAQLGSASERRKENAAGMRTLKALPGAAAMTPRTQERALEVFCDSDEDASPRRTPRRDDVLTRSQLSDADKLRQNPFLYYAPEALSSQPAAAPAPEPSKPVARPALSASQRSTRPSKPTNAKRSAERHAAPLARLYPGVDIAAAVQDKARPVPRTAEVCMDEIYAQQRGYDVSTADPWAYLDERVGRWWPEPLARPKEPTVRRAPSPTLVTKAAIQEVDLMFNGDSESDEASDESSETDDDDVCYPIVRQDENGGVQPTPLRTPMNRRPFGLTPGRTPFGQTPSRPSTQPLTVAEDEDEEEEEEHSTSGPAMMHVPFQPLTPITERTEISRFTSYEGNAGGDREAASTTFMPVGGLRALPSTLQLPNPCSPADPDIVRTLLANLAVPVSALPGYVDARADSTQYLTYLASRLSGQKQPRRSSVGGALDMSVADMQLTVLTRLGEGGYGSVFLAQDMNDTVPRPGDTHASYASSADDDDVDEWERQHMLALKVEAPPNAWEYYILEQLRHRLPTSLQSSVVGARRFVASQTESLLLLEYASQGTLLELVNHASAAGVSSVLGGGGQGGMEEVLAMFFVIELCRVVEGMHTAGILHGDLKIDNCMIRSEDVEEWTTTYAADGRGGWAAKGIMLVDFGRAIDLACYPPDQRFLADWQPGHQDCTEMREMRPWTYQADYYGLASIAYCLLFGKYMDTTSYVNEQGRKMYKIQQPLRRYWQTELWQRFFDLMLNPTTTPSESWPITSEIAALRADMEAWLTTHSFHAGKNLKGLLKKVEIWALRRM